MRKSNQHRGSSFDDFLRDEAIFDDVQASAVKRALAEAVLQAMKDASAVGRDLRISLKRLA